MLNYKEELRRCQTVLILRIVLENNVNISRASEICGVHRNTIQRVLCRAGYNNAKLKKLAAERGFTFQRKPVDSVSAVAVESYKVA